MITKLTSVGFNEQESLDIILTGLLNQNKCRLFRLTLNGIATNRILNWQGPSIHASNQIMQFLEKLGIDENTLQTVREKGVSEEAQDMLNDLGYSDSLEEIFPNEEEVKLTLDNPFDCYDIFNRLFNFRKWNALVI